MKKLAALSLALALSACTSSVPDEEAAGPNESSEATSEQTGGSEPTEGTPDDEPLVSYGLPVAGLDIDTGGLVTHLAGTRDTLTVTHTYAGREPIETSFEEENINERLGFALNQASDCPLEPIVYMPGESTCEGSDAFVDELHTALDNDPLINPASVTVTLTPDLPDGREAPALTIEGTTVSDGTREEPLNPEHAGELYYSILALLTKEPSGDYCDTAAGATLTFTHDGQQIYSGDFGICQIEAFDYVAFNTINDIISESLR